MLYDQQYVIAKLLKWEKYLKEFSLPTWEELPPIDLYMDQVVALLTQYLGFLPREEADDKIVSASAINNYVRLKIMPPPTKKRYARTHIAYLIIICTLKQVLNISDIQKILPPTLTETEIHTIYNNFVTRHKDTALFFTRQSREMVAEFLDDPAQHETPVENLVLMTAIAAGLSKLLVQKLTGLQNTRLEDATDPALAEFIPQISPEPKP